MQVKFCLGCNCVQNLVEATFQECAERVCNTGRGTQLAQQAYSYSVYVHVSTLRVKYVFAFVTRACSHMCMEGVFQHVLPPSGLCMPPFSPSSQANLMCWTRMTRRLQRRASSTRRLCVWPYSTVPPHNLPLSLTRLLLI